MIVKLLTSVSRLCFLIILYLTNHVYALPPSDSDHDGPPTTNEEAEEAFFLAALIFMA